MDKEYTITINRKQLCLIRILLKDRISECSCDVRACDRLNLRFGADLHRRDLDFARRLLERLPSL